MSWLYDRTLRTGLTESRTVADARIGRLLGLVCPVRTPLPSAFIRQEPS
ncbi:MAG: hypothetical protein ABW194_11755 [Novosphingobium sp.]